MRKIAILLMIVSSIFLLSSCDIITDLLNEKNYEVTFHIVDEESYSVMVTDFTNEDFNMSQLPNKTGYDFKGWYLDENFTNAYIPKYAYESALNLYAKFEVKTLNVSIYDTVMNETNIFKINYGSTLSDIEYSHEGVILTGYKYIDDDATFDINTEVTTDLDLYTVFESSEGYVLVTFETNTDLPTINRVSTANIELEMPNNPVKEGQIFVGWFTDNTYLTFYDFNELVTTDLTLYGKFVTPTTIDYEVDDTVVSFEGLNDALKYQYYIKNGDILDEPFTETLTNYIDLKPFESLFLNETEMIVKVVFPSGEQYVLFNVFLKFDDITIYNENFESSAFLARTNYSNNTNPRIDGPLDYQYSILNGTASTTNPIEGLKSVQLRNGTNTPYLQTNFLLEGVTKISFLAKSSNHNLSLKVLNSLGEVLATYPFELTTTPTVYQVAINQMGPIKFKFELVATSNITTGEQIFIDDIKVFGSTSSKVLVEIIKEEEQDTDLEAIRQAFETHRSKLTPPGFNALSNEGLLGYYASLNGLTGNAFKTELTNILVNTHRRLISYDEARFVLEMSDIVTNGDKTYLDGIYSGHEIVRYWDGGATWAREHVWPNSRLAMDRVAGSNKNQASDVHNLRAIDPRVNSSRSNRYFMEATSYGLVGTTGYYPGDNYKGDVARILFYMVARYPDILTLRDDNIIDSAYTSEGAVMGVLSLLIKWHKEDPVSPFEINRNNVIYSFQGNRNPFIDFPEYVDVYFN